MGRLPLSEVGRFARELAALLRMEYDLPEALLRMAGRATPQLKTVLTAMQPKVLAGATLQEAIAASGAFPDVLSRGITGADSNLVGALERVADMIDEAQWRHLQMAATLAYPKLLVSFGIVGCWVLLGPLVHNSFADLFDNMNIPLPLPTKVMIALSYFFASAAGTITVMTLLVAIQFLLSGEIGRSRGWPAIPGVGGMIRRQDSITWCLWMDHLLGFGVPLPDAVRLAAESCMARQFQERMLRVAQRLRKGGLLTDALASEDALPSGAGWLVFQAERKEFAPGSLASVAHCLDRGLNGDSGMVMAAMEPIGLVLIGSVVCFFVLAMFLPLYFTIGQLH